MYGLKQAAILAYTQLVKGLANHGYKPCPFTTGIWKHTTHKARFCLCVNDFGVKVFNADDKVHFLATLQNYYTISIDNKGTNY